MSKDNGITFGINIYLPLECSEAFKAVADGLKPALARLAIEFEASSNGRVIQGTFEVGRVVAWEPAQRIAIEWQQASWQPDEVTEVEFLFEPIDDGTQLRVLHHHWGRLIGDGSELAGWFSSQVVAPLLRAMAPEALGDWITDRRARRPSGKQARTYYRDPLYHYPNFRVILLELALAPHDYFLEVGCGGGVLLKEALQSGCRAAAIDHSPEMVQLAQAENHEAIDAGRLKIIEATADHLPFPDATFTSAAMTGVLAFLSDPVLALAEIWRVLQRTGRFIALGSDPKMRGTPAAPEPIASRLHFYEDDELGALARKAGFKDVRVVRRDMEAFAREVGIPEEALPLFTGPGGPFLIARKG